MRKWNSLSRTVGQREGVGLCQTGSLGERVDGLALLGPQHYTTISYVSCLHPRLFTGITF